MSKSVQVSPVIRIVFVKHLFSQKRTAHVYNWNAGHLRSRVFDPKTGKCDAPAFMPEVYDFFHDSDDDIRKAWRMLNSK